MQCLEQRVRSKLTLSNRLDVVSCTIFVVGDPQKVLEEPFLRFGAERVDQRLLRRRLLHH